MTDHAKRLCDEVLRRFPEIAENLSEGNEELAYEVVGEVVDWLASVAKPALAPDVVQRVLDFHRWCQDQPRGESASDDILTIEMVAFFEDLFRHDALLPLVVKLASREDLVHNEKYLTTWVGADRYQAALQLAGGAKPSTAPRRAKASRRGRSKR